MRAEARSCSIMPSRRARSKAVVLRNQSAVGTATSVTPSSAMMARAGA
jgi:hypothetical protein